MVAAIVCILGAILLESDVFLKFIREGADQAQQCYVVLSDAWNVYMFM